MGKVLVTGGLGFIGSHTSVELIAEGYDLAIVDDLSNSRIEVLNGIAKISGTTPDFEQFNLVDRQATVAFFEKHKIDAIIHFAAHKSIEESVNEPLKYYRNNLTSLLNLLDCTKKFGIQKVVFSSSCTVYGQPDKLPVTELSPIKEAVSPYGNTKQIGEEIIKDFVSTGNGLKAISLRYFNPIGAHESALIGESPIGVPNTLVPFITQTAIGIRETLSVFGGDYNTIDGSCIRDYIHVVDLANAHIKALKYTDQLKDTHYDFFNVGTGNGYSVLQAIKSFEKVSGQKLNYEIVERRQGDIEKIYADTTKANNVLGWKAKHSLDDMMSTAWNRQQKTTQEKIAD